jgi:hypothetical protein
METTNTAAAWTAYAAALACKNVRDERDAKGRVERCLAALGYVRPCGRCGGGGHYSRNAYGDTRCYDCTGRGEVLQKVTARLVAEAAKRVEAGELDAWRAANVATAEAKRAIAPLMADINAAWSKGAVHTAYKVAYKSLSSDVVVDLPVFRAVKLINSASDRANALECPHRSGGMNQVDRLAQLREVAALINEINAAFAAFDAA